jgi:hypothetical protein
MRAHEFLTEHQMDNVNGWGATPINQNVDYMGLRVRMSPEVFLKLAARLTEPTSSKAILQHLEQGGKLAAPFLLIDIPEEWEDGDLSRPASVSGHEGRNRMIALQDFEGTQAQEVHIFPRQYRNRHMTPKWIEKLNSQLYPERSAEPISGPFWRELIKKA